MGSSTSQPFKFDSTQTNTNDITKTNSTHFGSIKPTFGSALGNQASKKDIGLFEFHKLENSQNSQSPAAANTGSGVFSFGKSSTGNTSSNFNAPNQNINLSS